MDYSKFQDDDFDVKEWVNGAFKAQKDGSNDQYATTLVMKLQMFIQEVLNIVEESSQQAVNNLPRVSRELEAVKQEAALLQEQMKMVKYDIQKVEHDTAQSMQMLLKLDTIKTRMKLASDALREADNWTTLSADVEEVFDSQDLDAIAKKINGMKHSLLILTDVPDYAERCQYLELLKNRLEAVLSPHVVAAFTAQSLDAAQRLSRIFIDMDRESQLCRYYRKCQTGKLCDNWKEIIDKNSKGLLADWLAEFYDELLTVWQTQMKWCSQVFSDPAPIVCDLFTETLSGLDPSISSLFPSFSSSSASDPSPKSGTSPHSAADSLIEIRQVTDRFVKRLESVMESQSPGAVYLPCSEKLAMSLFAPYKQHMKLFCQYEDTTLTAALDNIILDHEEVLDCVNLLSESVSKLFSAAKLSNQRCIDLTSGVGYISLPKTIQDYLRRFVCEFERVLVNIREKCHIDSTLSSPAGGWTDPNTDEWSSFHSSLRIIQTCGDLILHVDELDELLVTSIISTVGKYCQAISPRHRGDITSSSIRSELRKNPFYNYKLLLLESSEDKRALDQLIERLEEGDSASVLSEVKGDVYRLCEKVHKLTFDIVFAPLQLNLQLLPNLPIWRSETAGGGVIASNLPTFSLAPQEYITKIGQYLMTLPQQLEPFTMEGSPTLTVALKHGKLPYTGDIGDLPDHIADLWLESVARSTMHVFSEQILKINQLTEVSTKQLIVDIDYLTNVLDDLGLTSSETIKTIVTLLKATEEEYLELTESCPQRLYSAIANLRSLRLG